LADNIYTDLKKALDDFKTFLDANTPKIKPAITALKSVVPQITDLLDKLIELLGKLKTEVQKLDVTNIPGIAEVSAFTGGVKSLLTAAKDLLPGEAAAIDEVLSVADVVTGLPSIDQVKADILGLLDAIVADLNSLKS